MSDKKPSEVFLALWYSRISGQVISREEFFALAESWEEIRRMEENAGKDGGPSRAPAPTSPPEGEKSTPDEGEKVHEDASKKYAGTPPSDACGASSPEGGAEDGETSPLEGFEAVQNGPPARDASAIGKKAYTARVNNLREVMDRVRAGGVSTQSIADACGLTLNDILDFLEGKTVPLPKLAKLGKGLGALEGKT